MDEDIKITFIIPKHCRSEDDCSEEMQLAFTTCEQYCRGGLQAQWVRENEYNQFEGLTKRDVFVFSDFEGDLFEKLKTNKHVLIVGPRCLSCCLTEGTPIPSGPEPIFTVAMRGLVVTASGLDKQKKEKIRKQVFWMGGIYLTALTDTTTHLVSDTVLSDKYVKSIEKGIPVMCESWIDAVWEASLRLNINGSSSDFDNHKLPPFANLQVTTSGISKKDKQMIQKLVNEHGGTFSGAFQSESTDIVVLTKDGVGSEKYKAALEYGKACVLPSWIKESARAGVALPLARYRVAGASTSSPLQEHRLPDMKYGKACVLPSWIKESARVGVALPLARYRVAGASTSSPIQEHRLPDMSLNFSRITNLRPPSNFVDETRAMELSTMSGKTKLSQSSKRSTESSVDKSILSAFENLDMSSIKKAGPIFDGFCIWVTGLEGVCRERACACVSRAGGVRYDCPHPRVTHAVAGTQPAAAAAAQALPNVPVLSALWLARSVEAGRALDEAEFLLDTNNKPLTPKSSRKPAIEPASPMSKRNLQLLRNIPELPPPTPEPVPEVEAQPDIVNHYLSQNMPEPDRPKTPDPAPNETRTDPEITEDEPTEEIEQIFAGLKLEVQGLEEEAIIEIGAEIAAAGGVMSAAGAGGTHVLLPMDFDQNHRVTSTAEPVTVFWIKDCLSQQELLPIQYYHRPVRLPPLTTPGPLHGVVASLSTYSGVERAFLDELAKLLGATTQLRFCRRNTANAIASTHLICPTPVGDKYTGAVKWGLPAVTADWLLACAEKGRRVSERPYLVGETKAPPSPEPQIEEQEMREEHHIEPADVLDKDKENVMLPPAGTSVPRRGSLPSRDHTPKGNAKTTEVDEMSPASRYIAMARQGLLGSDSQETPKRIHDLKEGAKQDTESALRTPPLDDALSTPNLRGLSPTTRRRIQAVRRGEMPSDPIRTPNDPFEKIPTPDSGFGAALRPGSGRMSPDARKRLWKVVNELPTKQQDNQTDKHITPLSEIRKRFLAQFNSDAPTPPSDHIAPPRKLHLQGQDDTPPAKIQKITADQSAGTVTPRQNQSDPFPNDSVKSSASASNPLPPALNEQLDRLDAAITAISGQKQRRMTRDSINRPTLEPALDSEPGPESQPNTVGWDDTTPHQPPQSHSQPTQHIKRFMLSSNVDNREEIIEMIQTLGGEVCEGTELDLEATHLLCCLPGRSEKMLGSIAAGRWVLHPAYIARSRAHGKFLHEEEYEWGNPKATCLPTLSGAERTLARAAYKWRSGRAAGLPGPFAGVVALLHVPPARKRLLARLVTAGDGLAPDDEPPYSNSDVTVCFADVKRCPLSAADAAWLTSRRVPVCAPVLLSNYLTDDVQPDPMQHCLPDFRPA